ncbi:MAG: hypothetical protein RMJ19_10795, partial [Gemmatales bacterium]|nr:hypothetical protein [Gemmatales bacterium]MDW8176149.1 hypothetical protein [Gemmatales bacterium]
SASGLQGESADGSERESAGGSQRKSAGGLQGKSDGGAAHESASSSHHESAGGSQHESAGGSQGKSDGGAAHGSAGSSQGASESQLPGVGAARGSAGEAVTGIPLPPFTWHEPRRARLRAELDAYYAGLYGLTRKQLRYILDPADLTERELADILDPYEEVRDPLDPQGYAERRRRSTFFGETFRVLRDKELRRYGEYRTRRLVLEAWARLTAAGMLRRGPEAVP